MYCRKNAKVLPRTEIRNYDYCKQRRQGGLLAGMKVKRKQVFMEKTSHNKTVLFGVLGWFYLHRGNRKMFLAKNNYRVLQTSKAEHYFFQITPCFISLLQAFNVISPSPSCATWVQQKIPMPWTTANFFSNSSHLRMEKNACSLKNILNAVKCVNTGLYSLLVFHQIVLHQIISCSVSIC